MEGLRAGRRPPPPRAWQRVRRHLLFPPGLVRFGRAVRALSGTQRPPSVGGSEAGRQALESSVHSRPET
eukprot:11240675-Alexandrium_andersonii.AAC.1